MWDSAIRHLAVAGDVPLVAAALFESTVQIWSLENSRQLGEFETILDYGGDRLVLTARGNVCVTGSWHSGLAAYSVPDGKLLWHRQDLVEIQRLTADPSGQNLYCSFEDGRLAIVEVTSGFVNATMKGVLSVLFGGTGRDRLIVERCSYRVEGDHHLKIPVSEAFRVPHVAFSPESVCISNKGIRCVNLRSGEALWNHSSLSGQVAFATSDHEFYCVAQAASGQQSASLIRLAPDLLDCDQVASIGRCWGAVFTPSGNALVTMRGAVSETSTGDLFSQLNFPHRDYPDR